MGDPYKVKKVKKVEAGTVVIEDDGAAHHPVFRYRVKEGVGPDFGFTLMSIPEDNRDWLIEVVTSQIHKAYEFGRSEKTREMQESVASLLRQMGIRSILDRKI